MRICVITDDNAGIEEAEANALNLTVVPMPVIINGETYYENKTIDEDTFYARMERGDDIKTSQPLNGDLIQIWNKKLEEGYDQIIHMPMSSGLSASCATAISLAEKDEYKGKVFVVDNHRISVTLYQAVYDVFSLIDAGYEGAEIKEIMEKTGFDSSIYIMVDTMKYLVKGGRCTPVAGALAGVLNIKPVLSIFGEKLDAYKKALGTNNAKKIMIDAVKNDLATKFKDFPLDEMAFAIAYTHNLDVASEYKERIKQEFNLDDSQIKMRPLSLSVATHIGPGALALAISHKIQPVSKK